MVDCYEVNKCYRCLPTFLLPISPAGHRGPEVIFFDNLSSMSYGTDENSNSEQDSILSFLIQLRHKGFCCIAIHHTGKTGDQRGASRREDFLDFSIKLGDPAEGAASQNARFVLSFSKIRRRVPNPSTLDCELIELPDGGLGWLFESSTEEIEPWIVCLKYCQNMKPADQKEIVERLRISKASVSRHLKYSRSKGYLDDLKVTHKGAAFLVKVYGENG